MTNEEVPKLEIPRPYCPVDVSIDNQGFIGTRRHVVDRIDYDDQGSLQVTFLTEEAFEQKNSLITIAAFAERMSDVWLRLEESTSESLLGNSKAIDRGESSTSD